MKLNNRMGLNANFMNSELPAKLRFGRYCIMNRTVQI
jgi:hypothetical protein